MRVPVTLQLRYILSIEKGNSKLQKVIGITMISTDIYLPDSRNCVMAQVNDPAQPHGISMLITPAS